MGVIARHEKRKDARSMSYGISLGVGLLLALAGNCLGQQVYPALAGKQGVPGAAAADSQGSGRRRTPGAAADAMEH